MPGPGLPPNTIEVTVLDDGSVKITTSAFAPAVHARAERALGEIRALLGGAASRPRPLHAHGHAHGQHAHEHEHGPETHEHG